MMKTLFLILFLLSSVVYEPRYVAATVAACTGTLGSYTGDASTTIFPYTCRLLAASDINVLVDGVTKTLTTDYSVSAVGSSSGNITFVAAPVTGASIKFIRSLTVTQSSVYKQNEAFPATRIERDYDRQTMISQMLNERSTRSVRAPDGETLNMVLPSKTARASKTMGFDSAGLPIAIDATSASGTTVIAAGSTTARSLAERFAEIWNVKDYGAVVDGVTDDSTKIQAAIAACEASGTGGFIKAPRGVYAIATKLLIVKSNCMLIGDGKGHQHDVGTTSDAATKFLWSGAAGGTMLEIAPVIGASNRRISGGGVKDIGFYCNGTNRAAIGLLVNSIVNGFFDLYAEDCSTVAMRMGVVATLGESRDTQHNQVYLYTKQAVTGSGIGLELTGDATANASFNVFQSIQGVYFNSTAINLINADNNWFPHVRLFRMASGTGVGVVSHGGATSAESARGNRFGILSPADGGVTLKGTPTYTVPTKAFIIDTYDTENGAPGIIVETGTEFVMGDYTGRHQITDVGWIRSANTLDFFGNTGNKTVFRMASLATGDSFLTASHGAGSTLLNALGTPANINLGIFVKGTGTGTLSDGNSATKVGWNNSGIGFFATTPIAKPTIAAAGTDAATTQTLANSIRTILINYGLAAP